MDEGKITIRQGKGKGKGKVDSGTVSLFAFQLLIWQIVRRLLRPSESGCRIFYGPQLKEKCLKDAVFGRLALIHIWIKSWVGFGDHKCIAEELGGAFLSISPQPKSSNLGKQYFFRFDLNWICFGNMNSDFFWPFKASKLPNPHSTHLLTLFKANCSSKN